VLSAVQEFTEMTIRRASVRVLVTTLCFLTGALGQRRSPQAAIGPSAREAIQTHVAATMKQYDIPALSLSVQFRGASWTEGYGLSDVENAIQAKANSVYRLASVSKVFTATAVMQLVERGRIELDAPIQRYVHEYPEKDTVVTIRQLLNHTS
jgi:CubicO group peptidase (beta-lactamase class C family)